MSLDGAVQTFSGFGVAKDDLRRWRWEKRGSPQGDLAPGQVLESITGDVGGRAVLEAYPESIYYVDIADSRAGMDIDTWEQYRLHIGGI